MRYEPYANVQIDAKAAASAVRADRPDPILTIVQAAIVGRRVDVVRQAFAAHRNGREGQSLEEKIEPAIGRDRREFVRRRPGKERRMTEAIGVLRTENRRPRAIVSLQQMLDDRRRKFRQIGRRGEPDVVVGRGVFCAKILEPRADRGLHVRRIERRLHDFGSRRATDGSQLGIVAANRDDDRQARNGLPARLDMLEQRSLAAAVAIPRE